MQFLGLPNTPLTNARIISTGFYAALPWSIRGVTLDSTDRLDGFFLPRVLR